MAVIPLEEPRRPSAPQRAGFALFALGFRPFYLLAALLAFGFVPLWIEILRGGAPFHGPLPALLWHGHEMLFGFALAVIIGFLFTAVRNWTNLPTPVGWPLAALALLWLAGRVALLLAPHWLAALLDLALLPLVIAALARVLLRSGNRRNYFVLGILAALWFVNLLFHLAAAGLLELSPLTALHAGVAVVTLLETLIAGRIVPMFTANALRVTPWRHARVDQLAIAGTASALLCWAFNAPVMLTAALAAVALLGQLPRCHGWRPWGTWRNPLLWMLHLSHGWLLVALALLALSPWWAAAAVAALHVLTVGAMAGLILAMITRTTLGHTGRMLVAGPFELAMFVLLQVALLTRVLPGLLAPHFHAAGLWLSASAWMLCFLLYLWRYAPMLVMARVDGREG